jgi:hypothetical protein
VEAATAALRAAPAAGGVSEGGVSEGGVSEGGAAVPTRSPRPDRPRIVSSGEGAASTTPIVTRANRPKRTKEPIGARAPLPPRPTPVEDLRTALGRAVGTRRLPRVRAELDDAAKAYDAEHFAEALRLTRKLVESAPEVPEIRELHGLALYRLGRWRDAIVHLEAFRALSGTAEENHVLADCYRALERWHDVDELWDELRAVSPNAEVVNEGRIVVAGSLADRGDLGGAIRLLEKGWRRPARPQDHHLRRAYALADLYERSGQTVRARELFRWVLGTDRAFADVAERVRVLG